MRNRTLIRILTVTVMALVLAVPAIAAESGPPVVPDALDRYRASNQPVSDALDRYLHNTPDGYQPQLGAPVQVAFVRPDGPDGHQPYAAYSAVASTLPAPNAVGAEGFDWRDAGVGAGVAFGLGLLAGGAALTVRDRRRLAQS
jgi:hypothetical protein